MEDIWKKNQTCQKLFEGLLITKTPLGQIKNALGFHAMLCLDVTLWSWFCLHQKQIKAKDYLMCLSNIPNTNKKTSKRKINDKSKTHQLSLCCTWMSLDAADPAGIKNIEATSETITLIELSEMSRTPQAQIQNPLKFSKIHIQTTYDI